MNTTDSIPKFLDYLGKISNYIIGSTLVAYLGGFIITNIYLGYLGVINFEIIRARYVLVGILFIIFICAIYYLVYGLLRTITKHGDLSSVQLVLKIIWHSLQNFTIIGFAVTAISILAGTSGPKINGIPLQSTAISWTDWLMNTSRSTLWFSLGMTAIIILSIYLIILIIIVINPKNKDGIREPREKQFKQFFSPIGKVLLRIVIGYLIFTLFIFFSFFIIQLIYFMSSNFSNSGSASSPLFNEGWIRYVGGIILIYVLIAIIVTAFYLSNRNSINREDTDLTGGNPLRNVSSTIYGLTLFLIFILPLYTYGIYSYLPQQIGGGKPIKVELLLNDKELLDKFSSTKDIFLIDHTSGGALLMIVDDNSVEYELLEIKSSSFNGIRYINR